MVFVKIGREGGKITEYVFNEGITLRDVLSKSGIALQPNDKITVPNGTTSIGLDYRVVSAENVFIIKALPPQINIRASRIGETLRSYKVDLGSTINKVLSMAGITVSAHLEDVWIHRDGIEQGVKKSVMDTVLDGDIIVIEPKKTPRQELIEMVEDLSDGSLDDSEINDWVNRIVVVAKKM